MSGLFARQYVRCRLCGTVLREVDDYCPACCAPRVSARILKLGGRAIQFLFPIIGGAVIGISLWGIVLLRERRWEEQQGQGAGASSRPPSSITQLPDWQKWINNPTR